IGILYWARIVFITAILAVIIALILEPFVSFLTRLRLNRSIAAFVVCVVAVLILYFVGLSAWNQVSTVATDVPALRDHLSAAVEGVSTRIQSIEDSAARFLTPAHKAGPAPLPPPPPTTKKMRRAAAPQVAPVAPPGFIPEVRIHEDRNPVTDYVVSQIG